MGTEEVSVAASGDGMPVLTKVCVQRASGSSSERRPVLSVMHRQVDQAGT